MLRIQWWLLNRLPIVWLLWCTRLLRKYKTLSWGGAWGEANVLWEYHNKFFRAKDRFSPLQVLNLQMWEENPTSSEPK